jgi:hypothetical protein
MLTFFYARNQACQNISHLDIVFILAGSEFTHAVVIGINSYSGFIGKAKNTNELVYQLSLSQQRPFT